jgi:hypothetical protein
MIRRRLRVVPDCVVASTKHTFSCRSSFSVRIDATGHLKLGETRKRASSSRSAMFNFLTHRGSIGLMGMIGVVGINESQQSFAYHRNQVLVS